MKNTEKCKNKDPTRGKYKVNGGEVICMEQIYETCNKVVSHPESSPLRSIQAEMDDICLVGGDACS